MTLLRSSLTSSSPCHKEFCSARHRSIPRSRLNLVVGESGRQRLRSPCHRVRRATSPRCLCQARWLIHRSDGSGTTYIWTDYLSKVSSEWANGPGKGTSVKWPVGLGGKGAEGLAAHTPPLPP